MNYLVLARRTRPQSLNELIGQNPIRDALKGMLESKKVPHAFLLSGARGTGKTSTARILAKSLNCEHGVTTTPCQSCAQCKHITASAHEDVLEIDAASYTGVDNIRELRESAYFYPTSARYKIFIIDEVHMLSNGAFNALLKILEEPPAQVIFVLATTELHKIPITIRSRCLTFGFKKIDESAIIDHLKHILKAENISFDQDALVLIAREARGSVRDALSLLEQALALRGGEHLTCQETRLGLGLQNTDSGFLLFAEICKKNHTEALRILTEADQVGIELSRVIETVANYCRNALVLKSVSEDSETVFLKFLTEERTTILQLTKEIHTAALSEIFKILSASVQDIQRASNPLNWAEIVVLDAINRADWLSASEMLLKLQNTTPLNYKTASPEPVSTTGSTAHVTTPTPTTKIDMNLYKKFIEAAKKRSQTLAARLNFVQIEEFNKNSIKFADTAENATYLAFDSKDQKSFQETLAELELLALFEQKKNSTVQNKTTSLYETHVEEKKTAFSLKEKEILNSESVKNLMLLSKEIQLTPIEN